MVFMYGFYYGIKVVFWDWKVFWRMLFLIICFYKWELEMLSDFFNIIELVYFFNVIELVNYRI